MLILTRNTNQSIMIDTTDGLIEIKVLTLNDYQVRLGIEAPKEIAIHREEIYYQIQQEAS